MTKLTYTAGVPAFDHHSHAAYVRPGEDIHGFDGYEREYAMGHVEANMPHEEYIAYTAATVARDHETVTRIAEKFRIEELIQESIRFQSTTVHASSLAEGCEALYGSRTRDELATISRNRRREDFLGLYDQALHASDTVAVLTDIPSIDHTVWPHSRYKGIARIDPYFFPFGHPAYTERGADTPRFQRIFSAVLDDQLRLGGLSELPTNFDDYLTFVLDSLSRRRQEGFVGVKIASAYVRTLSFEPVSLSDARLAYTTMATTAGHPDPEPHKLLADFMAYEIAAHASSLGMPLQIHTGMGHSEPGLKLANANPLNLERFLDSPRLNQLRVILIHGGYPYSSILAALSQARGNVFVDFSWMPYLQQHSLHRMLQEWLEVLPANKVMFGTDTGSPELHVAATRRARVALDAALNSGTSTGLWSVRQAGWLAERVMHQNLCDVYGITL